MPDIKRHLDTGSLLVILFTFLLFIAALFFTGFVHDLLLMAGIFLVSVKLIMAAYKSSITTRQLGKSLDGLQATLKRMESQLESRRLSEFVLGSPKAEPEADGSGPSPRESQVSIPRPRLNASVRCNENDKLKELSPP